MNRESHLKDKGLYGICMAVFFTMMALFLWISMDILIQGVANLNVSFLTDLPENAGRSGGIRPVISSTLIILTISLLISFPISFASAIILSGKIWPQNKFHQFVQSSVTILAGVPSIVFGLFGNVFFCQYLGLGYSLLSGGLTLACMILPLSIKLLEEAIRSIPKQLIISARALNLSRRTCTLKVIIPAIAPQMTAAYILSIGRALAETAALLFTSGYVMRDPRSLLDSGRTLSIHIFDLSMNITGGNQNAYQTALILMIFLLAINGIGHGINKVWRTVNYGI